MLYGGVGFPGAKFSYCLLLVFAFPLLMETEFVLGVWLREVPEYAVIFTRLMIVNSLLESFTYVMGTSIQATGRIKWYQLVVGGTILLNLPLAWLLLRLGFAPSAILFVCVGLSCVTLLERLLIMRYLLKISFWRFVWQVFGKALEVTLVASVVPVGLHLWLPDEWMKFAGVIFGCVLSVVISVWGLGLSSGERDYCRQIVRRYLKCGR